MPSPYLAILFALACVLAAGLILWTCTHRPRAPLGWTHEGTPPAGADAALELLRIVRPPQ